MDVLKIKDDKFIKTLDNLQLIYLASDIRSFILDSVSKTGGHLSSNLGDVEAILMLHKVFDLSKDRLLFDVGHQAYTHKILEGNAYRFDTLRQFDGLSGFVDRNENENDIYESGHSSTSISTALGIAKVRDDNKDSYDVISFIGDASIVSGIALEAINHISNNKVIIILNDNGMAIDKPVGNIADILSNMNVDNNFTINNNIFKNMSYLGVIDGHDFNALEKAFKIAKENKGSILVHIKTIKGLGYDKAINNIDGRFHGVGPFDIKSGISKGNNEVGYINMSKAVARYIKQKVEEDNDCYVIGNAMVSNSFMLEMFDLYPNRCIDVGISEDHSISFANGMALVNKKPYVSLYSTFMQRGFDQISNDVCRINSNVTFLIDNAGIVEASGKTHQGLFDEAFIYSLENSIIVQLSETKYIKPVIACLDTVKGSKFIRYQRAIIKDENPIDKVEFGKFIVNKYDKDNKVSLIVSGCSIRKVIELVNKYNLPINVFDSLFVKPLDEKTLDMIKESKVIVYDNSSVYQGFASEVARYYSKYDKSISYYCLPNKYLKHGKYDQILKYLSLDEESVILDIKNKYF